MVLAGHLECQGLFSLLPLCWDLEFVHKYFKSAVLISYTPPILSVIIPNGFQNQLRGGLSYHCWSPGLKCPMWGPNPYSLGRISEFVIALPLVDHLLGGVGLD